MPGRPAAAKQPTLAVSARAAPVLASKENRIVALKLNVEVSRKVGLPAFGSVGASCNLEVELDVSLIDRDLDAFHARVRDVYVAAHQAVNDDLARQQALLEMPHDSPASSPRPVSNGQSRNNGHTDHPPAGRPRPRRPATEKRVRAIGSIASRQQCDLDGLLREYGVDRLEDLSIKQASDLIDTLNAAARV
jgi:hypothetical protein